MKSVENDSKVKVLQPSPVNLDSGPASSVVAAASSSWSSSPLRSVDIKFQLVWLRSRVCVSRVHKHDERHSSHWNGYVYESMWLGYNSVHLSGTALSLILDTQVDSSPCPCRCERVIRYSLDASIVRVGVRMLCELGHCTKHVLKTRMLSMFSTIFVLSSWELKTTVFVWLRTIFDLNLTTHFVPQFSFSVLKHFLNELELKIILEGPSGLWQELKTEGKPIERHKWKDPRPALYIFFFIFSFCVERLSSPFSPCFNLAITSQTT